MTTKTATHTPLPWACAEGGDFEHEGYIESWIAIVPADAIPESKYDDIEELACVGRAIWRYQVRHRERSEAEDEANAAYIVRACNNYPDLLEALKATTDWAEAVIDEPDKAIAGYSKGLQVLEAARAAITKAEES